MFRAEDDAGLLVRTIAEGGPKGNAVWLIGKTDSLDAVKRLLRNSDVRDDARTLVRRFDDQETLEEFFELDVSRADKVRKNLARFSTDKHFSASRAEQFVKDTEVVKDVDGFDQPAASGGRTIIDGMADAGDAGNLKGFQREVRIAADRINNGETVKAIGRETFDSSDKEITDIDVELENEIIESKSTLDEDEAIDKLQSYEEAVMADELELDGKTVTFDSDNQLSDSAKDNIRDEARDIEQRNNGIDNIVVEFDNTAPVEVGSE